nr:uncharacterized protein LOC117463527 [Pseudochaenichthys georgianus]
MASRKKGRVVKTRTGLRSERKLFLKKDEEWDTAVTSEEEGLSISVETQGATPKIQQRQPGPSPGAGPSTGDIVNIVRDFIAAQQRRDDILQEELRGLRVSVEASQQPVHRYRGGPHVDVGPSLMSSPDRFGNPSGGVAAVHRKEPKMPVYQNGEDIENYLLRFERMAKTWQWPREEWACRLVPLLTGKALEAYTAMDEDMSNCYPDLREALLVKFDISPETYRQRFRATSSPPGETPTESYHRLKGLYRRSMRPEQKSKEQMGETIILEQLLQVLPPDTRTWVKEHEPEDGLIASKLAMQFLNARKGTTSRPTRDETRDWNHQRDNFPKTGQAGTQSVRLPPEEAKTDRTVLCAQKG